MRAPVVADVLEEVLSRQLLRAAHDANLLVHSWTARRENAFLPRSLQKGDPKRADFQRQSGDIHALLMALYMTGIDGVFSDFPAINAKARDEAVNKLAKLQAGKR